MQIIFLIAFLILLFNIGKVVIAKKQKIAKSFDDLIDMINKDM